MFLAPKFFLGERSPPNFSSGIIKFSQIPTTWQSFRAIGRGSSENEWRNKKKKDTSRVKHKPVRNGGSGGLNSYWCIWLLSLFLNFCVYTQQIYSAYSVISKIRIRVSKGWFFIFPYFQCFHLLCTWVLSDWPRKQLNIPTCDKIYIWKCSRRESFPLTAIEKLGTWLSGEGDIPKTQSLLVFQYHK